jgi:hypothetical protein
MYTGPSLSLPNKHINIDSLRAVELHALRSFLGVIGGNHDSRHFRTKSLTTLAAASIMIEPSLSACHLFTEHYMRSAQCLVH